ncbi:40S ribosomal protein S15-like [Pomacea canaliculata]|uniref:40S ribosomal protein S15-like n=1 Tax=Pomacea canaliculata TaxID=400727 RepID=UPI000D7306D3|nr:40S ribosomal protein S15-like [Pomacea canaliculata]
MPSCHHSRVVIALVFRKHCACAQRFFLFPVDIHHGGRRFGREEEEAYFPQVHLSWCRPRPVARHEQVVKTHLRDMIIVPEMIGSIVGVYNGKTFNQVEIKPEMIGHYLGEFSITYKPVKHGRPGIGATHSSRFIPLK